MPNFQRGGHASILLTFLRNFAILATQRGGHGTMAPPKYAPDCSAVLLSTKLNLSDVTSHTQAGLKSTVSAVELISSN